MMIDDVKISQLDYLATLRVSISKGFILRAWLFLALIRLAFWVYPNAKVEVFERVQL